MCQWPRVKESICIYVWQNADHAFLKYYLHRYFTHVMPNVWTPAIEARYFESFLRHAPTFHTNDNASLVNFSNTMLDLSSMATVPHNPKFSSQVQLNVDYDSHFSCPSWLAFIDSVFMNDTSLIALVQEMFGYALIDRSTTAQKVSLLVGNGSNGKSILADILVNLAGNKNTANLSLRALQGRFGPANLIDKILNISTENEFGRSGLDTEMIKSISSSDSIMVERKGQMSFSCKLHATLIFCMNQLPYASDRNFALRRRLVIVPFERTFVDQPDPSNPKQAQKDPHLLPILLAEKSGIVNWAIEGLQRLQQNNYCFTKSDISYKALNEFMLDCGPFLAFVQCAIVQSKNSADRIEVNDLYNTYSHGCREERLNCNAKRSSLTRIRQALTNSNIQFENKESGGKTYIAGIEFSDEGHQLKRRTY